MMAGVRQCLGIDIGSHSIRIAEVSLGASGVTVKKVAEARLELEPGQKESQRQSAIVQQINRLIKSNKFKSRQGVFCVPGQTVFVRRLKLPATTPERLERIIRFEAREQIPFPLEKTHLEYQVFKSDSENEVEVLLVAIKREFIDNFMKLVNKTGIKPLAISVSSLAVHNFHEINGSPRSFGEILDAAKPANQRKKAPKAGGKPGRFTLRLGKKKDKIEEAEQSSKDESAPYDEMELEEIQAEVNLGATILDLAIPQGGRERLIGFTRSVPVAGSQIDRAIRAKLGLESLQEALQIKENETVILASDFEIAGDADSVNMPASEAATVVVDNIIAELRRSLDFYISQPDGVAVDSIVLSGGLARMSYLSNYLEEKMGIPVELASIKNEKISVDDELVDSISLYVTPVGLALQGLGLAQVAIDFLPPDVKKLRELKNKKVQISSSFLLLFAAIALGKMSGDQYLEHNRQITAEYDMSLVQWRSLQRTIKDAEEANQKLKDQFDHLAKSKIDRRLFMSFEVLFLKSRPPDILIESIKISREGIVRVSGITPRRQAISNFRRNLEDKTLYINGVELTNMGFEPESDPRFKMRVIPFEIEVATYNRAGRYRSVKHSKAKAGTQEGFCDDFYGEEALWEQMLLGEAQSSGRFSKN